MRYQLELLLADLRLAGRALLRQRFHTALAVVTLALGIGSVTAIYSVVEAVLLRPLPFAEPERLMILWNRTTTPGADEIPLSKPDLVDYRRYNTVFEGIGTQTQDVLNLRLGERAKNLWLTRTDVEYFDVLGTEPLFGRTFDAADLAGGRVAILSHSFWQDYFGGDPGAIGRQIDLDSEGYEVIGVMPPGFVSPTDYRWASWKTPLWLPMRPTYREEQQARDYRTLAAVARLRPGVTREAATTELDVVIAQLRAEYPEAYPEESGFTVRLVPALEEAVGAVRGKVQVLFGAVVFVLLIACVNVAHLLLVRAEGRRQEMAVRAALGAGRLVLVRRAVAESLILAAAGGACGLLLSVAVLEAVLALQPGTIPRLEEVRTDATVVAFALLATGVSALLCGVGPVMRAVRGSLTEALKSASRTATVSPRQGFRRRLLIAVQVAMTVLLLVGAGLLIRTLAALAETDPGFRPENVLTGDLILPVARYADRDAATRFYELLLERVTAIPGVASAGVATSLPIWNPATDVAVHKTQALDLPATWGEAAPRLPWQVVSAGYFKALGVPLFDGRVLTANDRSDTPPVAVVNRALVHKLWGEDAAALGRRIRHAGGEGHPWLEVVGVVDNVRDVALSRAAGPQVYVPMRQVGSSAGYNTYSVHYMAIIARTTFPPKSLITAVAAVVRELDPEIFLGTPRPLVGHVADSIAGERFAAFVLGLLAAVALALAVVGIYGILAFWVTLRRTELGVRLALGASPGALIRLVVRQGVGAAVAGVLAGTVAAIVGGRVLEGMLYGVAATDPATFLAVAAILLSAAAAASYLPARRAGRVDPAAQLHGE